MLTPFSSIITHENRIGRTITMYQSKLIDQHSIVPIVADFGSQVIVKNALLKGKRAIIAGY